MLEGLVGLFEEHEVADTQCPPKSPCPASRSSRRTSPPATNRGRSRSSARGWRGVTGTRCSWAPRARKTSITLNNEVLDELDRNAGGESRSAYIERVLRRHFVRREKAERESRELERIDAAADRLNAEMAEVARMLDTRQQFRVV